MGAAESLGVAVFPEAAAEMTGFAKSTRNAPGLYLLVDVGAMTLDASMFRLNQHVSDPDRYAFLAAQVRPLGVDSFHWFLAEGKTESGFIEQCQRSLNSVVWETRRRGDPNAETWKPGNDVPVFLAGGGAANRLHQDVVESIRGVAQAGSPQRRNSAPRVAGADDDRPPGAACGLRSNGRCLGLELPAYGNRSHPRHE